MTSPNTRQPIFSAGQSDVRAVASQILLTLRQRLTPLELTHCRNVLAGLPAVGARSLESLAAIRDRAARRPMPRRYGFHRRAA